MLARLLKTLFGCRHKNYSFPMTIKTGRTGGNASGNGMHVVCFDCSRDLAYDWVTMKVRVETVTRVSTIRRTNSSNVGASVLARVPLES